MLKLWQSKGVYATRFFTPDDGSGSGGSSGSGNGEGESITTPFDDIALDELDEQTRQAIEKGKRDYIATLQRAAKLDVDLSHAQELSRRFQSEADRAKAEYEKVTGKSKTNKDDDPLLDGIRNDLKASGYKDEDVEKMAPTFLRMFTTFGGNLKQSIGKDLGPLASNVLMQQATTAFEQAQDNDTLGMLQVPEVAEHTWKHIQERVKTNQQTTPEIVLNLAKMAFMDYAADKANKGEEIELTVASKPDRKSGVTTNFTFPGASRIRPTLPTSSGREGSKTTLNADTQQALASTFREMTRGTTVKAPINKEVATR